MDCSHEERSRHSSSPDILPNSKGELVSPARACAYAPCNRCVSARNEQVVSSARARVRARVEV